MSLANTISPQSLILRERHSTSCYSNNLLYERCELHFQTFNINSVRKSTGLVTVTALETSRSAGCYICTTLLTVDLTKQYEPWPNDPHETLHGRWHFFESRCELRLSIEKPNPPLRNRIARKRIDLRPLKSGAGLLPPSILAPNVPGSIWGIDSDDMTHPIR